jgi:hypothetical protein
MDSWYRFAVVSCFLFSFFFPNRTQFLLEKKQKMIRSVRLFKFYVQEQGLDEDRVLESCILAIKLGLLHVDATNQFGSTIGAVHLLDHDYFHSYLWDKYWSLGPDVATFWSSIHKAMFAFARCSLSSRQTDILKNTPALWSDLGLVQKFAAKNSWLEGEVHRRIRMASLRFAWMAAVVLL